MSALSNSSESQEPQVYETASTPRWIIAALAILLVLLGYVAYAGYQARTRLEADLAAANEKTKQLAAQLEQTNARITDMRVVSDATAQKLGLTQAELARARTLAQSVQKEQKESTQQLSAQIGQVKQESESKIGQVSTDLGGAKSDIEATRKDLEATKGRLERTVGDLGVQSGLIARNREELEELKRRGERNIFEFTLTKARTPSRVGPVQLKLEKVDTKRYKYTMTVYADDKSIEKKDKTVNEPVQFLVGGAGQRQLLEVIVFEVGKDRAVGYLTTPKLAASK